MIPARAPYMVVVPERFILFVACNAVAASRTGMPIPQLWNPVRTWAAYFLSNAASKACAEGLKSTLRTNSQASVAPCSRSIPPSSHSTESGPS